MPLTEDAIERQGGLPELLLGISVATIAFCLCLFLYWGQLNNFLRLPSDTLGYYQYLPAFFLDGDMAHLSWTHHLANGNTLNMFQIGVAVLQLPFFLIGHVFALALGYPISGYSSPYCVANMLGAALYCGAGITSISLALKPIFGRTVGMATAALLFLATNLYYYSAYQPGMSHVYSFFLVAIVCYLTPRYWTEFRSWQLFSILLALAMIVLIRSYNGIVLFYFLFHNKAPGSLLFRSKMVLQDRRGIVPATCIAIVLFSLQMAYWKLITGNLVVFTYAYKEEGFFWTDPQLWNVLFSHQNGWFAYHPILLFAMVGLVWTAIKGTHNGRIILAIWIVAWYLISSWWCWWFGGAFGHRAFVEYIPLLALPFAFLLDRVNKLPTLAPKILVYCCFTFMVYANLALAQRYKTYNGPWDGDEWTWVEYRNVLKTILP